MEVFFLGTGAGIPSKGRNVTAIALKLLEERGAIWLFDCGEATQHQILHTSIKPGRIEKIFITHLHGDHIYGLPGLLASRSFQGGESALTVYGPAGIKEYIETSLRVSGTYLKYPLEIKEITEKLLFEDGQFTVEARELEHGIQSFGFRVVEKDRPGTLLVDRLKELGIKPGPQYRQIKEGTPVTLEDGTVLEAHHFLGPRQLGRIVAILGDTRKCEAALELAQEADLLVHEATFAANDSAMAYDYFHSTTEHAAQTAKEAGVKKLCLTHISSRYDRDAALELLLEARKIIPETEIAEDFKSIIVPRI
ncbi:ribonuclease Z [Bacillus benzoevorans]|uniref:Ribonuclease Z n=1 Tax=Bacillus benzoevorans TaxID=1456 RepID=A0A7X0HQ34_9BACI|nr:ribonuclease Z [Bacillus benzoevorans]MBB6444798.1 ribonuclease Z [Bacillus benzoevorans]